MEHLKAGFKYFKLQEYLNINTDIICLTISLAQAQLQQYANDTCQVKNFESTKQFKIFISFAFKVKYKNKF